MTFAMLSVTMNFLRSGSYVIFGYSVVLALFFTSACLSTPDLQQQQGASVYESISVLDALITQIETAYADDPEKIELCAQGARDFFETPEGFLSRVNIDISNAAHFVKPEWFGEASDRCFVEFLNEQRESSDIELGDWQTRSLSNHPGDLAYRVRLGSWFSKNASSIANANLSAEAFNDLNVALNESAEVGFWGDWTSLENWKSNHIGEKKTLGKSGHSSKRINDGTQDPILGIGVGSLSAAAVGYIVIATVLTIVLSIAISRALLALQFDWGFPSATVSHDPNRIVFMNSAELGDELLGSIGGAYDASNDEINLESILARYTNLPVHLCLAYCIPDVNSPGTSLSVIGPNTAEMIDPVFYGLGVGPTRDWAQAEAMLWLWIAIQMERYSEDAAQATYNRIGRLLTSADIVEAVSDEAFGTCNDFLIECTATSAVN
ncbi:MAG: hypothetical protein IPJ88_06370 [Myxococcales bacterium]|nr:MAG: hypothetical protein IPJ88_06370 [Myxococcales bacterium]